MSLQNVSNHKQLLIAKNIERSANLAGAIATPSLLADGEVVVTDLSGRILTITTAAESAVQKVVIVQGQGATKPLIKSTPITKQVLLARAKRYVAATQQISTVGYNGSTGNIVNPGTGENIVLRNTFKTNFYQFSDKLMESVVGMKVASTDTIYTIADKLTKYAIQDVQAYVNIPYKVERVADGTKTATTSSTSTPTLKSHVDVASGTTACTVSATNNSAVITFNAAAAIQAVGFAAGDYIELSGIRYKIASVASISGSSTTLNVTLDTAYQGATATIAAANVKFWNTSDETKVGIKFTGLPQRVFGVNTFRYETSKFVTSAMNFSTTEIVNAATVGTEGSGVYEQIAEEEFFFQLAEGMHDNALIQIPPVTMRSNVETTGTYSVLDIEFADQAGTMSFINNPVARKQVRIAANILGGIATDAQCNVVTSGITGSEATGIREVLNAFITGGVTNSFAVAV